MKRVRHEVKILPEYFRQVFVRPGEGTKRFELRKDDRNYQIGDSVTLREWIPEEGYTGNEIYGRYYLCYAKLSSIWTNGGILYIWVVT